MTNRLVAHVMHLSKRAHYDAPLDCGIVLQNGAYDSIELVAYDPSADFLTVRRKGSENLTYIDASKIVSMTPMWKKARA